MRLTVATVALNAADELPLTLESVIGQDYPDIELLVVDGASWDETPHVLSLYENDIDRLEVIEDGGIFAAMNQAVGFASGEMILFLNAGDRFHSANTVSKMLARRREGADIIYGNHIYRSDGIEEFRPSWDFGQAMEALRRGAMSAQWLERFPAHQATMTRTALLRDLKYDLGFRVCADHDFFLRAVEHGANTQFIDEIVCIYAGGGFSLQRHALLKTEWNALHRRFSADPESIDFWYYGGHSPFQGTRARAAGDAIAGLHAEEPAQTARGIHHAFRWLSADGARFVTPSDTRASGMMLTGTNPIARQSVQVFQGGTLVGEAVIPQGVFAADIAFHDTLAPSVVIDIVPEAGERLGTSAHVVALAVRSFSFKDDATTTPRRVGDTIKFNKQTAAENAELMGAGWYQFEPTFVWSRGQLSEVRIASEDKVSTLTFDLRPNPAVPGQSVEIIVNGQHLTEKPVGGEASAAVGHLWRGGGRDNVIAFRPSTSANVGDDPRDLGLALVSIALS
ncbi:MAG: glycosyltransferase [Pseudomonadota bacterium]